MKTCAHWSACRLLHTAVEGELFVKQLHRRDLEAAKPLGAGQFGQVYLATLKGEKKVAVKMLRKTATSSEKDEFIEEAEIMLELEHENLVALVGVCIQQRPWLVVIEYMKVRLSFAARVIFSTALNPDQIG